MGARDVPPGESRWWRYAEVVFALAGCVASVPVAIAAAVAIVIEDGFPVFFCQARIGRAGATFQILKFRSMRSRASGSLLTARGDSRVTRVGRFLRRYKLDELPQLWNVVRGDMALVGPRPEVPRYVDTADPLWKSVLQFRPGITDLATLVHRDEEDALASATHPEDYYRRVLLPAKLRLNVKYGRSATIRRNLLLILL